MLERSKAIFESDRSSNEIALTEMRWHLSFSFQDFLKTTKYFYEYSKNSSQAFQEIDAHLKTLGVSSLKIFELWFSSLLLGILPLGVSYIFSIPVYI
jgi:hypothetical protein